MLVAAIHHYSVVVYLYQVHKTAVSRIRLWCRSDCYFHGRMGGGGGKIFRKKWSTWPNIPEILVPWTNFSAGPNFPSQLWLSFAKFRMPDGVPKILSLYNMSLCVHKSLWCCKHWQDLRSSLFIRNLWKFTLRESHYSVLMPTDMYSLNNDFNISVVQHNNIAL